MITLYALVAALGIGASSAAAATLTVGGNTDIAVNLGNLSLVVGAEAEHVHSLCRKEWRFIGNSSPSWLTSTDSRSPGRLER